MCGSHQPLKQSKRVHCTTTKSPSRWCLSCLLHSTLNKCSQRCSKTCKQFSIAQNTLWGRAASSILTGHYNTSSTVSNISTSTALCVLHHALQDCNPPPPPPPPPPICCPQQSTGKHEAAPWKWVKLLLYSQWTHFLPLNIAWNESTPPSQGCEVTGFKTENWLLVKCFLTFSPPYTIQ